MSKFNVMDILNDVSKKNSEDDFNIRMINIFDIVESKLNFYSTKDIDELADSIEMFGVQQNLVLKELENGKYELIAGHRRLLACRKLVNEGKEKFNTVPCIIDNSKDHIREKLLLIYTNSTARELSDYEKVEQAKQLKELLIEYKKSHKVPGRVRDLVAETLNISPTQVARMDSIENNLSDEFKNELKENKINISTAYELSGLDEEEQKIIYQKTKENENNVDTFKLSLKEIRGMKQPVKEVAVPAHQETERKLCKWDGKSICVAVCDTEAECCAECQEHGHCNVECGWQDERIPKSSGQCFHRPEYHCTLPEASKLAQGNGENCNAKCCWNCQNHGGCGYECNSSARRPEDSPETVNDESENVDNEPEIVNDVDEITESKSNTEHITVFNNCIHNQEYQCDLTEELKLVTGPGAECFSEDEEESTACCWNCSRHGNCESECNSSLNRKLEPVENVEADIIQTVPEEPFIDQCEVSGLKFNNWLKVNGSSIADIVSIVLHDKKIPDKDNLHTQVKNSLISRLISKTEAYYDYLTRELGIEPEQPKPIQPELPILKNNDQRKEFIDNYTSWPVWIDIEETGERYYRYNLSDKVAMVVKVSKKHDYKNYHETKDYEYAAELYYLLGVKTEWHANGMVYTEDDTRTFYECQSNKTALVDYLKYFQKKGAVKDD